MKYLVLLFTLVSSSALAQPLPPQTLEIPSVTATDATFLQGAANTAPPVVLDGRLYLPAGEGPFPTMVMLHGSAGDQVLGYDEWVRSFREAGVAALRVDSYTARGFEEIYSDQGRVGEFQAVFDAYRALDVLAQHPSIDPSRIGVIGFSRGGIGALYSAMTRFEDLYGSDHASFALHLPFYPPCNFSLEGELGVAQAPIWAFHGSADEWNPAAPCRDYIGRLKDAGANANFTEYQGARHAFDNISAPSYNVEPAAQTSRACFRREEAGVLMNEASGAPFTWADDCVENGPPQQFQYEAAQAATRAVMEITRETFGLD